MAVYPSTGEKQTRKPRRTELSEQVPSRDAILPIIEGARARGVADAFELIGQGALLLDATGKVLHAGASAYRYLGTDLFIESGHLVARTVAANQAIQTLLSALLDAGAREESVVVNQSNGRRAVQIRGFAFNSGDRGPYQLLSAILLINDSCP